MRDRSTVQDITSPSAKCSLVGWLVPATSNLPCPVHFCVLDMSQLVPSHMTHCHWHELVGCAKALSASVDSSGLPASAMCLMPTPTQHEC